MTDLIKRLRTKHSSLVNQSFIMEEAADRIEQLVKEVEAAQHEADEADAYAWNLENKLAKAVEALRKIADYTHIGESGQGVTQHAEARIARTTLAELEK